MIKEFLGLFCFTVTPNSPSGNASLNPIINEKNNDALNMSAYITGSALLFSAYFYFIAWIHLYYYFNRLGINLVSLDFPFYYFLVYAYTAIDNQSYRIYIALSGAILIFIFLDRKWPYSKKTWFDACQKLIFTLFVLTVFVIGFVLARIAGIEQARHVRNGEILPTVHLSLDKKVPNIRLQEISNADENNQLKLIISTKEKVYTLYQPSDTGNGQPYAYTYIIPSKYVLSIKVDLPNSTVDENIDQCGIPFVCPKLIGWLR